MGQRDDRPGAPGDASPLEDDRGAAFAELYQPIAPAVFAWASLHLGDGLRQRLDPEDVLQEVSCRALQSFGAFDPTRGNFRTWVFGIARNVLRQAMRRLGAGEHLNGVSINTEAGHEPIDPATTITRRVARQDTLRVFLERLQKLPEDERRLLIHRGLEGLSHNDVGLLLGLEPKTTAKRWDRLRTRLREDYADLDFFERA